MKTVKMKTTRAHPVDGCVSAGESITVDDKTAKELVDGGYAEEASDSKGKENEAAARTTDAKNKTKDADAKAKKDEDEDDKHKGHGRESERMTGSERTTHHEAQGKHR